MEIGPILLAVLWVVVSLIGRAAEKGKSRDVPERPRVPRREPQAPTRRAETFEDLLAEMRGQLDEARRMEEEAERVATIERAREVESWEEVEDIATLEREAEVVSLEVEPARAERPAYSTDAQAEAVVQRRIAVAEQRNRAWRLDDHRKFDQAIRQPAAVATRPRADAVNLRQAMIWGEILDRPVGLRD